MKAAVRKELCGSQEFLVLHSSNSRASPLHVLATQGTARLAQVRSRMKTLGSLKRLDGGLATWAVRGCERPSHSSSGGKLDPGPSFINRARILELRGRFRDDRDTSDKTAGSIDVVLDYTNALRHCAEGDGNEITGVRALVATVCRASAQVLGHKFFS